MKLKLSGATILGLLAIWLLSSCTDRVSAPSIAPNVISAPNSPASPNLELFLFVRNDKFGYIDRTGKIAIPARFDRAENFSEGLATVKIGERYGCIDTTGKLVIPAQFNYFIHKFKNGFARVDIDADNYNLSKIDRTGKLIYIPSPQPSTLESTEDRIESDGFIQFDLDGKYGYKNRQDKIVIPARFDYASERFVEGMAWVKMNDRIGYINNKGKTIVPPQFDYYGWLGVGNFDRGLARVCINSKCGYINKAGKVVIPLKFDDAAQKFSNGLAWVKIDKKLGYINKTGNVVIPAIYHYPGKNKGGAESDISKCGNNYCFSATTDFDRGLAAVAIPGSCRLFGKDDCDRYGYIDPTGKLIFEF